MPDAIIENPILNSPFQEPTRHFKFTDEGITNEIVEARRLSGYFVPIPQPKKKGKQLVFDSEWTQDRFKESEFINRVRDRVNLWRRQGWPGITNTTTRLLQHWSNPERERRLFFCQVEALETAIYLAEVADKAGDAWIANSLREANDIACWFLDTNYNEESFFVRHAYFTGAGDPYEKLKRALRAEINEAAWSTLYSTVSRPFDPPATGKIAIKVINHYGDEVLKVYEIRPGDKTRPGVLGEPA